MTFAPPRALSSLSSPGDQHVPLGGQRHQELLAQEFLDRQLRNVQNLYQEYYADTGFDLMRPLSDNVRRPNLRHLVGYIQQAESRTGGVNDATVHDASITGRNAPRKFVNVGTLIHSRATDRAILRQDVIISGLSMTGVLLMVVSSLVAWVPRERVAGALRSCAAAGPQYNPLYLSPSAQLGVDVMTYSISVTSVVTIIMIIRYYVIVLRSKKIEWCRLGGKEIIKRSAAYRFWRSELPWFMLLEIAIHLVIPYPFYFSQVDVFSSDPANNNSKYLELFMIIRLYTVLRLLHHLSPLYRMRHDVVQGLTELRRANFKVGFADTVKMYFYQHTTLLAFTLYFLVAIIGGLAVFIAERDTNNGCDPIPPRPATDGLGFNSWLDGIYFMVISIRTIGYGEMVPITIVGRLSTILFVTIGMFLESFIASVVVNKMAKNRGEIIVDEYLASIDAYRNLRIAAAMLIQAVWKSSIHYKYRHGMVSREQLLDVLRRHKRRRDLLQKMKLALAPFPVPEYASFDDEFAALTVAKATLQRRDRDGAKWLSDVGLRTMLSHFHDVGGRFRDLQSAAARRSREFYSANVTTTRDGIPYLRSVAATDSAGSSWELIERNRLLFAQDLDLRRWSEKVLASLDESKSGSYKFTGTQKVVGKFKVRRLPRGTGHKFDILLEAQKKFRTARLKFTHSLATSADFILDEKLLLVFRLLQSAAEKLRSNTIALESLRRTSEIHIASVEELAALVLSGGSV